MLPTGGGERSFPVVGASAGSFENRGTSACFPPARDSPLFSNEPALAPTTGEDLSPPPVGSTDLQKTDAAPSAAASSPGNPRESDGPTGDACKSTSGTRGFRTAIMYDATLGTRTLGEVRGPRTSEEVRGPRTSEEDLRGRDGTTASASGGELGRVTASFGNPRGTDGPSGGEALAEGSTFEEPRPLPEEPRFLPTRASPPDGPSVPRGFPNDAVTRPSSPPDALAVVPSRPRRSSSEVLGPRTSSEVLGPRTSPSVRVPSVASYMMAVRKPLVPLVRASPVGPSLSRGFPGELAAADGAASVF